MIIFRYEPEITLEQIIAFDPEQPDTYTSSAFINAVCMSFARNGYQNCKDMARSIGMDDRRFSCTFEVLTGLRYVEARPKLVEGAASKLHRQHPSWNSKRIAEKLGFNSYGSLWAYLPRDIYHQLRPETKAAFLRRMAREFDKLKE